MGWFNQFAPSSHIITLLLIETDSGEREGRSEQMETFWMSRCADEFVWVVTESDEFKFNWNQFHRYLNQWDCVCLYSVLHVIDGPMAVN